MWLGADNKWRKFARLKGKKRGTDQKEKHEAV